MVSTLSQTTPVGTVKKQKKRDYQQYRTEYGAGKLGQLVITKTCKAKDCRTQIAEANDAV